MRTPAYLKGKAGWVESLIGAFPNPEDLAYGLSGLPEGPCTKSASGKPTSGTTTEVPPKTACTPTSTSTGWSPKGETRERPSHEEREDHEPLRRAHQGHRGAATRERRSHGAGGAGQHLLHGGPLPGQRRQARGPRLGEPDFKALLLSDGKAAASELGMDPEHPAEFIVVENTPELHNLIVCTLCSCYPRAILGRPPDWYKSFAYRSRAVREPRAVMREFGFEPQMESRSSSTTAPQTSATWSSPCARPTQRT